MALQDILSVISKFAPAAEGLLSTFGGPVGTATAIGLKAITSAFGLTPDTPPDVLSKAIAADPQAALKLKQAELDFQLATQAQSMEVIKVQLADVQSARQREVEITKATGKKDTNLYALSWVIMGGFMGLIFALIVGQFAYGKVLAADPLVTLLLGSLSTDAGMVVGYFFGSSQGSSEKTALLAKPEPIK